MYKFFLIKSRFILLNIYINSYIQLDFGSINLIIELICNYYIKLISCLFADSSDSLSDRSKLSIFVICFSFFCVIFSF